MVYPHIQYQGPAYPDALDDSTAMDPRELDSRVSDGIDVRLRWHPSDGAAPGHAQPPMSRSV